MKTKNSIIAKLLARRIGWISFLLTITGPTTLFSQQAIPLVFPEQIQNDTLFVSFSGKYINDKVYLNLLVSELNQNTFFMVERSVDGTSFETIGNIVYKKSDIKLLYSFIDESPQAINSWYRIAASYQDFVTIYSETLYLTQINLNPVTGSQTTTILATTKNASSN
jgi:hypothetical protein